MSTEPVIAIIDDDDSIRVALIGLIRSLGYDARGFASAEDFLDAPAARSCACVITDIQMPGMSGIELQRHLAHRDASLPVIMITARQEKALEQQALDGGAACLLKKPFEPETLVNCLKKALMAR